MPALQSRTARSIIYLCCIGGLLVCNAFLVSFLWNHALHDMAPDSQELTFLEGAGLTAFAYVVVYSIRYGIRSASQPARTSMQRSPAESAPCRSEQPSSPDPTLNDLCSKLSAEQRAELKRELISNCGCKDMAKQPNLR